MLLRQYILLGVTLLSGSLFCYGQNLVVEKNPTFDLPCTEASGLYADLNAGLWTVCESGQRKTLQFHDGDQWVVESLTVSSFSVIPELGHKLLLLDSAGVFTLFTNSRQKTDRLEIAAPGQWEGEVRRAHFVAGGVSFLETTSGIYECKNGDCALTVSGNYQLLGSSGTIAAAVQEDGRIVTLNAPHPSPAQLPNADVASITQTEDFISAFVSNGSLYTIKYQGRQIQVDSICAVEPSEGIAMIGTKVLRFGKSSTIQLFDTESYTQWYDLLWDFEFKPTGDVVYSDSKAFYTISFDRVIATTPKGVISVNQSAFFRYRTGLRQGERPLFTTNEDKIALTTSDGITVLNRGATSLTRKELLASDKNLMRFSVPTEPTIWQDQITIGTSDGRVLHPTAEEGADLLLDLRGFGGYVFDLNEINGELWGAFDPTPHLNAGVFRLKKDGEVSIFRDTTGLPCRGLSVRQSPSGHVFTSTKDCDYLIYKYLARENLWAPVGSRSDIDEQLSGVDVHEIAPISDTLIYLATADGLLEYSLSKGYTRVQVPLNLLGKEVSSVQSDRGGVWFSISGAGIFYYRNGSLLELNDSKVWPSKQFAHRSLQKDPNGRIFAIDGEYLFELYIPENFGKTIEPVVRISQNTNLELATFATEDLSISLFSEDSLFIDYSVPGFATADLSAYVSINGKELTPAYQRPGRVAFGPPGVVDGEIDIRVVPSAYNQVAASIQTKVRFLAPWYYSASGIAVILMLGICLSLVLTYGYVLRQQDIARRLEELVTTRTADLEAAQQRAQRASKAKSMFLANMSHEIRTPLNAVLGMADLLAEGELSEEQHEYLAAIKRGGNSLHNIVGDVLDFAQVDNGLVRKRESQIEFQAMLHEIVTTYAEQAFEKDVFFSYDIQVPTVVKADSGKLRSILSHLLGNAVKFTTEGCVSFKAYVKKAATIGASNLVFEIKDTGIGIENEDFDKIFEVFEQVDNSNTRKYGGTGLGLAIVKTYVECLGGEITVSSNLGEGTVFKAIIPIDHLTVPKKANALRHNAQQAMMLSPRNEFAWQLQRDFSGQAIELTAIPNKMLDQPLVLGFISAADYQEIQKSPAFKDALSRKTSILYVAPKDVLNEVELPFGAPTLAYPYDKTLLRSAVRTLGKTVTAKNPKSFSASAKTPVPSPSSKPVEGVKHKKEAKKDKPLFFNLAAENPLDILIAEDNPMNKMLALTVLKKLGYAADWAENGQKAVDLYAAKDYDLILMDVHMPEMDGLEATKVIRKKFFERPVHICALTANASEEGREECTNAGMDTFLSKPLQVPRLIDVIKNVKPVSEKMIASVAEAMLHANKPE